MLTSNKFNEQTYEMRFFIFCNGITYRCHLHLRYSRRFNFKKTKLRTNHSMHTAHTSNELQRAQLNMSYVSLCVCAGKALGMLQKTIGEAFFHAQFQMKFALFVRRKNRLGNRHCVFISICSSAVSCRNNCSLRRRPPFNNSTSWFGLVTD